MSGFFSFYIAKRRNMMPTIDMIATGQNIRQLRDNAGMTTKSIANCFGISVAAVHKWIHGTSLPTIDNLVILADLFGVRMDDILVTTKHTAVAA